MSMLLDLNTKISSETDRYRIHKQLENVDLIIATSGSISLDHFFDILSNSFNDVMFGILSSPSSKTTEMALTKEVCEKLDDLQTQLQQQPGRNNKRGQYDQKGSDKGQGKDYGCNKSAQRHQFTGMAQAKRKKM
jgi:hypothetical protein